MHNPINRVAFLLKRSVLVEVSCPRGRCKVEWSAVLVACRCRCVHSSC